MQNTTLLEVSKLPLDKRVEFALLSFGIYPLAGILPFFVEIENYEACAEIKKALHNHCAHCGMTVPVLTPGNVDEFLEDYQAAFWMMGISGEIARSNFWQYTCDTRKLILGETT